ncbi:hypothetical protein [Mycetohabitans sp. B46]
MSGSPCYDRNTAISWRIATFVDYLVEALGGTLPGQRAKTWTDQ